MRRALAIFEKSLGGDHPNTKTVRKNYEMFKAEMAAKGGGRRRSLAGPATAAPAAGEQGGFLGWLRGR